jgi:YidC/Oxa1 family membrane protein insertase
MTDQKNTLIAIALSAIVLLGWQFFFAKPQVEKQQQNTQQQNTQHKPAAQSGQPAGSVPAPASSPQPLGQSVPADATRAESREEALKSSARVAIDTPAIRGSIALKGGRIDDVSLLKFRETIDPKSPPIILLSPSGSPDPFYAEFGWTNAAGANLKVPSSDTVWTQSGSGALTASHPVTLTYDNGQGLQFRRTISLDDKFLFAIKDEVTNKGTSTISLYPYALISRHDTPKTLGYYLLHEGLVGYLGKDGLKEYTYKNMQDLKPDAAGKKEVTFDVTNGWLGITDKYWAAALLPDTSAHLTAHFSLGENGNNPTYQTDYLLDAMTIAPGATGTADARLFAGAKEVTTVGINFPLVGIGGYNQQLGLNHFDLLIDWGWFYFLTKPMFLTMDFFFHLFGNFGIAILIVTVLVKILFFPLANKSYASMAKMKAVQPMMAALRERYPDDKAKQQTELMALYKKEKINPLAGCLPVVIQIPVFFSLYKVLYVTIEMRHAPFFGWIHDLSAPDPTNVFTLFGLLSYDPTVIPVVGHFMHLGAWALIMGVSMWAQMKLNPTPPDPTQAMIFNWMPVIFTFMLASFPAGLVIYWAWNNSLSVLQQSVIMRKHGVKIELWDNVRKIFIKKKVPS